jgi:ribose 5-phosphate isomerase B
VERAILVCGTGIGMAISANKVPGIRAAVAADLYSVERSVLSNNCQVLALGSRVLAVELVLRICDHWLSLCFDPESHSARNLEVLARYEARQAAAAGSERPLPPRTADAAGDGWVSST